MCVCVCRSVRVARVPVSFCRCSQMKNNLYPSLAMEPFCGTHYKGACMNERVDGMVVSYIFGLGVSFLGPADAVQGHIRGSVVPVGLEACLSNLREPQVLRGRNHIYGANTNTYTLLEQYIQRRRQSTSFHGFELSVAMECYTISLLSITFLFLLHSKQIYRNNMSKYRVWKLVCLPRNQSLSSTP